MESIDEAEVEKGLLWLTDCEVPPRWWVTAPVRVPVTAIARPNSEVSRKRLPLESVVENVAVAVMNCPVATADCEAKLNATDPFAAVVTVFSPIHVCPSP